MLDRIITGGEGHELKRDMIRSHKVYDVQGKSEIVNRGCHEEIVDIRVRRLTERRKSHIQFQDINHTAQKEQRD